MNKDSYKSDKYYPKVVNAIDAILSEGNVVAPVEVFMKIGNLDKKKYEEWRFGRIPSLESVIEGNLSKCSRILKLIGFHSHDLDLKPSPTVYKKWGKGKSHTLTFSKSKNRKIESAYSKCFVWNKRASYLEWKQNQVDEPNT